MMYTAKLGERGRITIPKELRDRYGLRQGMTVELELGEHQIYLRKRQDVVTMLEKYHGIFDDIDDVDAHVAGLRGR